jgi:hypothetical protein
MKGNAVAINGDLVDSEDAFIDLFFYVRTAEEASWTLLKSTTHVGGVGSGKV